MPSTRRPDAVSSRFSVTDTSVTLRRRSRERLGAEDASHLVDHRGDVDVCVGVNPPVTGRLFSGIPVSVSETVQLEGEPR